jgi:hypothetical protein
MGMGKPGIRGLVVVLAGVLACALVAGMFIRAKRPESGFGVPGGPVLAVLGLSPPRVMLVDPVSLEIEQTIALRSPSIDLDGEWPYVLTAQCGGPGDASDTVVGLLDLERGSLRYVDTGHLDPETVCIAGDMAMCVHGEVLEHGMAGAVVDIDEGASEGVVVPHGTVAMTGAGDAAWLAERVPGVEGQSSQDRLWSFDRHGVPSAIATVPPVLTMDGVGRKVFVLVDGPEPTVMLLDATSGSLIGEVDLSGDLPSACRVCAIAEDRFAVSDYDGADPDDRSGGVVILEIGGMAVRVDGDTPGPVAMAGTPGGLVVVCQSSGELVRVDEYTGMVVRRSKLTAELGDLVDVAYVGFE